MEARKDSFSLRRYLQGAYAAPAPTPRQRVPYHIGIWFDVLVLLLLLITAVGYFTS